MVANSWTGEINTSGEYIAVTSLTDNFVFTESKSYTMQVQNSCYLKIANAEFYISNEKFQYKATSDTLYIKTPSFGCVLTILEDE